MTEYEQTLNDLCDGLTALTKGSFKVEEQTELTEHLNLNSIQIMEFILDVEDRFDISIPLSVLPEVKTVKDLALHIEILKRGEE